MTSDDLAGLASGAAEIVPEGGLEEKLALGRPLRVKFGVDPSRPDLTFGHTVVLRKLRQFQDAGHVAVLIIGDFTARIGDPSGRSETRPMLSADEVRENAETYFDQAGAVIDVERAEIHGNAEWGEAMTMEQLLRLASVATVAQMLEREDFRARYQGGRPIAVVEFLYPLFQGYDSVAVEADIELGGTDQTFNLLMGREVQRAYGQDPQVVLTMPLLEGLDGVRKMSKSFDNHVALTDPPQEMFGKLMSIPDELIARYELLITDLGPEDHERVSAGLADGSIHPNAEKRRLARTLVDRYHGAGAGEEAETAFDRVFKERRVPEDVPEILLGDDLFDAAGAAWVVKVLVAAGLASSNGDARRAIEQGGIRLDGERVADPGLELTREQLRGKVLQRGSRAFARLT
ncbi:MAG TPA: tyrosine--tRNA ligase [Actinomycetota bacterium]|nr:tyrosine--tRNA ligase [Actinomycetota bacterium]